MFGLTAVALGAGNGPLTVLELKGDAQVTDPGGSRPLTVACVPEASSYGAILGLVCLGVAVLTRLKGKRAS